MKRQRFIDCSGGSSGSSLGFLQAFVLPIMAMARFVLKNGMLPLHTFITKWPEHIYIFGTTCQVCCAIKQVRGAASNRAMLRRRE